MDDGATIIARLPFKNSGPTGLLVRSEVATVDFVRTRLGVPIPKVLA